MANKEHLKILKQGVDVWNKWIRLPCRVNKLTSEKDDRSIAVGFAVTYILLNLRGIS
jgi:hypothetical protein